MNFISVKGGGGDHDRGRQGGGFGGGWDRGVRERGRWGGGLAGGYASLREGGGRSSGPRAFMLHALPKLW